jgi:signal transduction histidine kinase
VDVNGVILGMRDIARHLVRAGVRTVLHLDPADPHARADVEGLERALANILRNADDAMPQGGTVTIRTSANGRYVRLSVDDTGAGMPDEVRGQLFELGFTTKLGGHGIGLVNVRQFAEANGGTVEVESAPGRGTTVTLLLPLAPKPAA